MNEPAEEPDALVAGYFHATAGDRTAFPTPNVPNTVQERFCELVDEALLGSNSDPLSATQILDWVHQWLNRKTNSPAIWSWLGDRIDSLPNDDTRIRWCFSIWEPWVSTPASWAQLAWCFDWWHTPSRRWAVLLAYEEDPARLPLHFRIAQDRPEFTQHTIPSIDDVEFAEWKRSLDG